MFFATIIRSHNVRTDLGDETNSDCDAMMPAIRRTLSAPNGAAQTVRMSDAY